MAEEEEKEEEVAVVEAGFGGWVLLALARRRDGRESSYRGSFTWGGGVLSIYHWRACLTKAWLACPHPIINKRLLLVNLFALRPTLSLSLAFCSSLFLSFFSFHHFASSTPESFPSSLLLRSTRLRRHSLSHSLVALSLTCPYGRAYLTLVDWTHHEIARIAANRLLRPNSWHDCSMPCLPRFISIH